MKRIICHVAFCLCLVAPTESAAQSGIVGDLKATVGHLACRKKCRNNDADKLFPKGTIDLSCMHNCGGVYDNAPPSPGVRPSGNNRAFILLEPMVYKIGKSNQTIIVPVGFVTDYASIPKALWSLYSPHDQYSRAAVVHDYLYWSQQCTRAQADNIFMIAMKESGVPDGTRNTVYEGVHLFGEDSWKENQRQRAQNLPRVVPVDRRDFPPNWSWEMYRTHLVKTGVKDPVFSGKSYCPIGDAGEVPESERAARAQKLRYVERALNGVDADLLRNGL